MKVFQFALGGVVLSLSLLPLIHAADAEKTLKGTLLCGKCELKEAKTCHTVIKVKEGDKDVIYWLEPAKGKEHKDICAAPKPGLVVGTVSEKDGKKIVKVKDVQFD